MLMTTYKTLIDASNFCILLFLFIYTNTLLGMELFAYKVKFNENDQFDMEDGKYPNSNFNTFIEAFVSIFVVLANDGWSTIYFNHARGSLPIATIIFFATFMAICQFILLNLFLAILVQNFDDASIERELRLKQASPNRKRSFWKSLKEFMIEVCWRRGKAKKSTSEIETRNSILQTITL